MCSFEEIGKLYKNMEDLNKKNSRLTKQNANLREDILKKEHITEINESNEDKVISLQKIFNCIHNILYEGLDDKGFIDDDEISEGKSKTLSAKEKLEEISKALKDEDYEDSDYDESYDNEEDSDIDIDFIEMEDECDLEITMNTITSNSRKRKRYEPHSMY